MTAEFLVNHQVEYCSADRTKIQTPNCGEFDKREKFDKTELLAVRGPGAKKGAPMTLAVVSRPDCVLSLCHHDPQFPPLSIFIL